MKLLSLLTLSLLVFSSCTRVVYSHDDYMSAIKTKSDAISTFGSPTNKTNEGNLEVWTYILGSGTVGLGMANGYGNYGNNSSNASVYGSTVYSNFTREVTFIFDGNNAVRWNSRGIDFKKEEINKSATTWGIIGFIGGSTLFLMIIGALVE